MTLTTETINSEIMEITVNMVIVNGTTYKRCLNNKTMKDNLDNTKKRQENQCTSVTKTDHFVQ